MSAVREQVTTVSKEMGITHQEFYSELPALLDGVAYRHSQDIISFQLNRKQVEIQLAPEGSRELGRSMRLPVTMVTLRFFDFTEAEVNGFIKHFNLRFMKGGG